jgi:hypothetical protein
LNDETDPYDQRPGRNRQTTANAVSNGSSDQGANEGSNRQLQYQNQRGHTLRGKGDLPTRATIKPDLTLLKYGVPSALRWPKRSRKSGISRKPEI